MTIAEALIKALNEWKEEPDFDLNDKLIWLDMHLSDVVVEWAASNGFSFSDENCAWGVLKGNLDEEISG